VDLVSRRNRGGAAVPSGGNGGEAVGAVLVCGGGVAGIQASIDLSAAGFRVYLIEQGPAVGGGMARLDKTFPTGDCATCIISPKLVECMRDHNIDTYTMADVVKLEGEAGNFKASVRQRPRYVDIDRCTACGQCGQICQYGAIISIKENVLTFEQLCHSCGGCFRVCPDDALRQKSLEIGTIESGKAGEIDFVSGRLNVGHVRTPTLIKEVKKHIRPETLTIIDVPPGTSCPVVEAIKGTDFVLLVTEPTPFGLNDLKLAVELVRELNLPFAVVINRDDIGDAQVEAYCLAQRIEIAFRLSDDRRVAVAYSSGQMVVNILDDYKKQFHSVLCYLERTKTELRETRR